MWNIKRQNKSRFVSYYVQDFAARAPIFEQKPEKNPNFLKPKPEPDPTPSRLTPNPTRTRRVRVRGRVGFGFRAPMHTPSLMCGNTLRINQVWYGITYGGFDMFVPVVLEASRRTEQTVYRPP